MALIKGVGIGCPYRSLIRGVQGNCVSARLPGGLFAFFQGRLDWLLDNLDLPELGYLLLGLRVHVLTAAQRCGLENTEGACVRVEEMAERVNTNDACQVERLWTE
jgi:hypothetical protein